MYIEQEIIFENEYFKFVKVPNEYGLQACNEMETISKIEMPSEFAVRIDIGRVYIKDNEYFESHPEDRGKISRSWFRKDEQPIKITIHKKQLELAPKELLQLINKYTEILQSAVDIVNKAEITLWKMDLKFVVYNNNFKKIYPARSNKKEI